MWLFFALLSACCFGLRGILYHWTAQRLMNRNLMLFGVFFTGAVISLVVSMFSGQAWTASVLIGIAMGTFSFAANASMYKGFAVGKASIIAIFTGLPAVVVAIIAYLLWGEVLSAYQFIAFIIIVAGVLLIQYSNELSWRNLQGAQWGLLAMLFFGFNDTSGKQAMLWEADIFPTLFCMFITGSVLFASWWLIDKQKAAFGKKAAASVRNEIAVDGEQSNSHVSRFIIHDKRVEWSEKRTFLWGMVVGITNVLGMMLILPAFKLGVTGLVSAVVAINVLMILVYTRVHTKVKFTRLEFAGICFAFLGVLVLKLVQ